MRGILMDKSMPQEFYEEDEAEQILRLATRQNISGGVSRDALLQMAGEVGVTPEAVEAAERQYAAAREDTSLQAEFHRKQRVDYLEKLAGGLGSIAVCGGIWFFFMRGGFFWPGIVAVAIIGSFLSEIPEHFMVGGSSYQKAFVRWKAKREKKRAKQD